MKLLTEELRRRLPAPHTPKTEGNLSLQEAVENILDYMWKDESRDYFSRAPGERSNHIFQSLAVLRAHFSTNSS